MLMVVWRTESTTWLAAVRSSVDCMLQAYGWVLGSCNLFTESSTKSGERSLGVACRSGLSLNSCWSSSHNGKNRFTFMDMSTDPLMSAILDDLAKGRIDASEAARRIDALKAAPAEDRSEPDPVVTPDAAPPARPAPDDRATDPWAAATDRPQHATFARETVGPERGT